MKAVIIDDELKARSVLKTLIKEECPKIKQIKEADDLLSGIQHIREFQPELVFLDIEMPEYSGLEILDFLTEEEVNFQIIFTTAYNHYAIEAFKLNAVDYLLKPIDSEELKDAIDKAEKLIGNKDLHKKLNELKTSLSESNFKKIGLPNSNGIKFVDFNDIIMLEADGMYTKVSTTNEEVLVSKPLKFFVDTLSRINTFYRPHRSYLVNLTYLREYVKKDGGYIVMENNKSVSISKDKKEEFLAIVQSI
ncbi:LytTR family two component transcriptional regulator [Tenacibaculum skagerrakense]|uniref:LytTR family two component transcriptional regulator n=1 Tax=Tenacibaculum skagerrakense TaxID=186571 RepID=A0A4R2NTE9_9FLAO|nr:LytTR family DNA-binding domain-containing protein [Tenacibaculum skagerrakense]TCP25220.1 LytTR family two component transcriptional regulator [Tenacibaculum skagerrakense]